VSIRIGPLAVLLAQLGASPLWAGDYDVSGLTTLRDCTDCIRMRVLPIGRFMMGSPESETGRQSSEGPRHTVAIAKPFAISVYDVTVEDYAHFVDATGYAPPHARCNWRNPAFHGAPLNQTPNDPVVCVSWTDANEYTRWLSTRSGHTYRLPTEAEWEYAARAGSTSARYWGQNADANRANTGAETCCAPYTKGADRWLYTSPVGSFAPNRFGLFDMLGDVWQWTADCETETEPLSAGSTVRPGLAPCETHIARGGGWFHPPQLARSAARVADQTDLRVADIGFRVARTL
jgi:formylglycine-generating enzyme required for sulfatase activity